jgi:hypothetical protein
MLERRETGLHEPLIDGRRILDRSRRAESRSPVSGVLGVRSSVVVAGRGPLRSRARALAASSSCASGAGVLALPPAVVAAGPQPVGGTGVPAERGAREYPPAGGAAASVLAPFDPPGGVQSGNVVGPVTLPRLAGTVAARERVGDELAGEPLELELDLPGDELGELCPMLLERARDGLGDPTVVHLERGHVLECTTPDRRRQKNARTSRARTIRQPPVYAARAPQSPQPCRVWSLPVLGRSRPVSGSRGLSRRRSRVRVPSLP